MRFRFGGTVLFFFTASTIDSNWWTSPLRAAIRRLVVQVCKLTNGYNTTHALYSSLLMYGYACVACEIDSTCSVPRHPDPLPWCRNIFIDCGPLFSFLKSRYDTHHIFCDHNVYSRDIADQELLEARKYIAMFQDESRACIADKCIEIAPACWRNAIDELRCWSSITSKGARPSAKPSDYINTGLHHFFPMHLDSSTKEEEGRRRVC